MNIRIHTTQTDEVVGSPASKPKWRKGLGIKVLFGLLLVAGIGGAIFASTSLGFVNQRIAKTKEAVRPANIKLIKILAPSCTDCVQLDRALTSLRKQPVSITDEETVNYTSSRGQELIAQFNITKVPTYLTQGEVNKDNITGFFKNNGEVRNGTFVWTASLPVYVDTVTNEQVGKVTATILTDPACTSCIDLATTLAAYKRYGVMVTNEQSIPWNSAAGKRLAAEYKITKVPTIVFSKDIDAYPSVKASFEKLGTVETDGTYIIRNVGLPHRNIAQNNIVGLVDILYLIDSTCAECYKPEVTQRNVLARGYGMGFKFEKTIDINSAAGKKLAATYNINKVPTFLLSPNAKAYESLDRVWNGVGTIEKDGWYIFRELEQYSNGAYKNLTTGTMVRPESNN